MVFVKKVCGYNNFISNNIVSNNDISYICICITFEDYGE
jgi:hypothetical protein